MIGVEGMDTEQLQLGSSDKFWRLITERRKEKTMSHSHRHLARAALPARRAPRRARIALHGRVAIVTGAGSRAPGSGSGRAAAVLFAREGAKVLLVDRSDSAAEDTLAMIRKEGGEAEIFSADVTKEADCRAMVERAVKRWGKLDILDNNVGIGGPGTVVNVEEEVWDRVMAVNVKGMMLASKYAVPAMAANGGGAIVNISSIAGRGISPSSSSAYAAAKGGIIAFTTKLANELGPFGIMVNAEGRRFVDEGADFRNYTYAKYGRVVLAQPGSFAWQVFDSKVIHLLRPEYHGKVATRVTANSLEELAGKMEGVNPEGFLKTVREFNAAVRKDVAFNAGIKDGLCTVGIEPPKSNWAQPLDTPPFEAYHTTCGITFTFGGLRINPETAQVLDVNLQPIPGLYTAGEMVGGLFYFNYPLGSGLVSGTVFGRIAGVAAGAAARAA